MIFIRLSIVCLLSVAILLKAPAFAQHTSGLAEPTEGDLRRTIKIDFDESNLPARTSLEKFIAPPGDQGNLGSCASWAGGYYLASSIFAQWYNWPLVKTDEPDPDNVMSPAWIYKALYHLRKETADEQNKSRKKGDKKKLSEPKDIGLSLVNVGIFLNKLGALPLKHLPYDDKNDSPLSDTEMARMVQISKDFKLPQLGFFWERKLFRSSPAVNRLKAAIYQGSPAIVGSCVTKKFVELAHPFVWKEDKDTCVDKKGNALDNRHALTLVGYDDTFEGGAFRVVNSWGNKWADGGFAWISYESIENVITFASALEMVPDVANRNSGEKPKFISRPNTVIIPGEDVSLWSTHWSDIKEGDILESVFRKLGGPSNFGELLFLRGVKTITPTNQTWIYSDPATGSKFLIDWLDGVVKKTSFIKSTKTTSADPQKVDANWKKISIGMSGDALIESLGGPQKTEIRRDLNGDMNDDLVFSGPDDKYRLFAKIRAGRLMDFQFFNKLESSPEDQAVVTKNWKGIRVDDSFHTVVKELKGHYQVDGDWHGVNSKGYVSDGQLAWRGEDGLIVLIEFKDGFVTRVLATRSDPKAPASNPTLMEVNWARLRVGDTKKAVYLIIGGPDGNTWVKPDTLEPLDEFPWYFSPSTSSWVLQIEWRNGRIASIEKLLKAQR